MGIKSIASKIVDSLKEDDDDSRWLVCYDFDVDIPLRRFYRNRDMLIAQLGGNMIQYSVFVGPVQASIALHDLAVKYGAHVSKFRVENEVKNIV